MYILSLDKCLDVWIVDCGDVPYLMEYLSSFLGQSFMIKGVLLTHAHYDHIYGLPQLTELYPDVRIYTNECGKIMLADEKKNLSRYHEDPINYIYENVVVCEEGAVIKLFDGFDAIAHFTPGHNQSCITFEVGGYLFTGDSFMPGLKVVTNLPGGDKVLATESSNRILSLSFGKIICPGHVVEL